MKKEFLTNFYVVRHGQSEQNLTRLMGGHLPAKLTEHGVQQAQQVAELLKHLPFHAAFSSDLERAVSTTKVIIGERTIPFETTSLLRERFYGSLEKATEFDLQRLCQESAHIIRGLTSEERRRFKVFEGMESDDEVITRLTQFLRETTTSHRGKNVLVVSHGNVMRTLLVHLGHGDHREIRSGTIKNAGYFKLITDGEKFIVEETVGITKNDTREAPDPFLDYLRFYIHIV